MRSMLLGCCCRITCKNSLKLETSRGLSFPHTATKSLVLGCRSFTVVDGGFDAPLFLRGPSTPGVRERAAHVYGWHGTVLGRRYLRRNTRKCATRFVATSSRRSERPCARCQGWTAFGALGGHVCRLHDRIELACVRPLLARPVARFLPPAERHVIVEPGGRQIHHHEPARRVSLEVARVFERRRHDPGRESERRVVGDRERFVVVASRESPRPPARRSLPD